MGLFRKKIPIAPQVVQEPQEQIEEDIPFDDTNNQEEVKKETIVPNVIASPTQVKKVIPVQQTNISNETEQEGGLTEEVLKQFLLEFETRLTNLESRLFRRGI